MPKISVVMPVYNSERYLREAIDSILAQTFSDFEFIIIDDGSQDSSPDIVRSYTDKRIRFYQNEHNMGVAATLNRGLDLASGEYIARMDSDDISLPERFEKQIVYLETYPDIAVCGTNVRFFGAKRGIHICSDTPEQMRVDLLFNSCLAHPSVMMRGNLFREYGLRYEEQFNGIEDYAMWVSISQKFKLGCVQDILLEYRIHPKQITQQRPTEKHIRNTRLLKQRILSELDLPTDHEGFDAFLGSVETAQSQRQTIISLRSYLNFISEANKKHQIYDQVLLNRSLEALFRNRLDALGIRDAVTAASKVGVNPITYAGKRVIRRVRTHVITWVCTQYRRR